MVNDIFERSLEMHKKLKGKLNIECRTPIDTMEDLALVECFPGGAAGCFIAPACRLKGVLREALDAFLSVLDRYTIGDLTANNAKLRSLLNSEAA